MIKLPPRPRTPLDWAAEIVGTGFGSGLGPVAPATWGTTAALILYGLLRFDGDSAWFFVLLAATAVLGTAAAERLSTPDDEDPGRCVADEWAGAYVTVAFLPNEWYWLLPGFFVFRVLDVLKPWPARRLERLHGGFGVMADDIAVGVMGAVGLNIVRLIFFN